MIPSKKPKTQEIPMLTKNNSTSDSSLASNASGSSRFTETWVCDCCGSTTFDFEPSVGCDHEERSLHFVETS
eukprot:CAMPEP_0116832826 /NCGR_PEP_ID=MMETSP0418-20121206/6104_1 /TAXON_ID=1158023 /ORGANISM="Astrosyne radiata, Strain 13vi08-1A" /LENGTH=71 /DNA_ID=CAMNT_0004462223 /DNA_START=42 /DNA_END=257 /DNA_ORIENTATION=-